MKKISKMKLKSNSISKLSISSVSIVSIIAIILCSITVISALVLSSSFSYADTSTTHTTTATVVVNASCSMGGGSDGTSTTGNSIYSATIDPGTTGTISGSRLSTICNDPNGYSIYAIGYSNDSYTTPTNTEMISSLGSGNISTNTSGTNSYWAMKLSAVEGLTPPTILNNFNNWHVIPQTYTQIAKYTSATSTGLATGATVQTSYQVHVSNAQMAATYTGKVKYTMVHPNNTAAPTTPLTLNAIASSGTTHYMQESIDCPNTTAGTTATLTDNRDNQTYIVGKAADGNCWMLQNLKLGKSTTTKTLTPADSDVGSNFTLNNKLSDGKFHSYTIDGVQYQNNSSEYYCTDAYGCYYNWYTATAGTGTTYISTNLQSVNNSICPAGWTLPTGGSGGQFQVLANNYNNSATAMLTSNTAATENTNGEIPGLLLGGFYGTGGAGNVGVYGVYWSRTAYSAQSGYSLYLNTSSVNPSDSYYKYVGRSVRCLLR